MLPLWRRAVLPLLDRATHRTACGGPGFSDAFLAEKSYWEERYSRPDSSRNHFDWLADSEATLEQVLNPSHDAGWYRTAQVVPYLQPGDSVLDLGCGTSSFATTLSRCWKELHSTAHFFTQLHTSSPNCTIL